MGSVLANSSKFIDDSFEEEQADLTNSSSAIEEKWEENIVGDFTNNDSTLTVVEPIVVEQSVLADSSTFIQITEEEVEQEKDGSLFSTEVEVKEEEQFHWYEEYYGDYIDLSSWDDTDYDHVGNIMEFFDVSPLSRA